MNAEELRHKIKAIFGEQVLFNKEFDAYAQTIKNIDETLIPWCEQIRDQKIPAISNSRLGETIVFIKKIGSSDRCIIIKIKNDGVKEVHLGDHKYYDFLRKKLGLKENSRMY